MSNTNIHQKTALTKQNQEINVKDKHRLSNTIITKQTSKQCLVHTTVTERQTRTELMLVINVRHKQSTQDQSE